jgi:hypothetical protein
MRGGLAHASAYEPPQAILICHLHRAAPTLTTVFEIAALAGHLLPKAPSHAAAAAPAPGGGPAAAAAAAAGVLSSIVGGGGGAPARRARTHPLGVVAGALRGALHLAHGFAPAVVVAQAVRLAANLVREAEARRMADTSDDKATTEGARRGRRGTRGGRRTSPLEQRGSCVPAAPACAARAHTHATPLPAAPRPAAPVALRPFSARAAAGPIERAAR